MNGDASASWNHKYHLKADGQYYCEFCGARLEEEPSNPDTINSLEDLSEVEELDTSRDSPAAKAEQKRWRSENFWKSFPQGRYRM